MKVLITTDGIFPFAVGGIQRHSRLLIEALSDYKDLQITVVHPHKEKVFSGYPSVTEIHVDDIDTSKTYLLECYRYSQRVYEAVKDLDFDIVYAQGISIWYDIDKFKDKLIVNPHGLEAFQAMGLKDKLIGIPFRIVQRYIFKKAKIVASEGGHLTTILRKCVSESKIVFLPNSVRLVELSQRRYDSLPLQCFFMGRFVSNKGILILMDAIRELNQKGYANKMKFVLGGTGPLFKEISSSYQFENVSFKGFVSDDDLSELYRTSDVFVFPTLFEGMPTVILEAMSHGLPVIATDTGAIPELVEKSNGYLIQKASVSALVDAIISFYDLNEPERKSMSDSSRRKIENTFSWPKVAESHYSLFKKILSENSQKN